MCGGSCICVLIGKDTGHLNMESGNMSAFAATARAPNY